MLEFVCFKKKGTKVREVLSLEATLSKQAHRPFFLTRTDFFSSSEILNGLSLREKKHKSPSRLSAAPSQFTLPLA
jgi:hypothetical protein